MPRTIVSNVDTYSKNAPMLIHHLPLLAQHHIVLASASPRRKELLQQIGLKFEIHVSTFEENLNKSNYTPVQYVQETAIHKAVDVRHRLRGSPKPPVLVIGADTVSVPALPCHRPGPYACLLACLPTHPNMYL